MCGAFTESLVPDWSGLWWFQLDCYTLFIFWELESNKFIIKYRGHVETK